MMHLLTLHDKQPCAKLLFESRVSLKYFVNDCLWKSFLILTFPRPLKLSFFDNFSNSKVFHTVLT